MLLSAPRLLLAAAALARCAQAQASGAGVQLPWPPPPSSIAAVALVLAGLCVMLGVLGLDGWRMREAAVKREEELRRLNLLAPKRRMSVAELFGLGGHSHSSHSKGSVKKH
jgi:hypothetical protein